jgi:hypothetical protein
MKIKEINTTSLKEERRMRKLAERMKFEEKKQERQKRLQDDEYTKEFVKRGQVEPEGFLVSSKQRRGARYGS